MATPPFFFEKSSWQLCQLKYYAYLDIDFIRKDKNVEVILIATTLFNSLFYFLFLCMSVKDVKHQPPKSLLLTLLLQFAQTNMPLTITSAVNLQQWVASMTKSFHSFFLNMKLLFLISRECGKKRREHFACFSKNCKESNCFVVSMYKVGDILEGLDKLDKKNVKVCTHA